MFNITTFSSSAMVFAVEEFLEENYLFRRNVLSGKTEWRKKGGEQWEVLSNEAFNSIVRHAKKELMDDAGSPRNDIQEYIYSHAVPTFNPIANYLDQLPEWDGTDHITPLFNRLTGVNEQQKVFAAVWLRSMVAHWLQMDTVHGNECVPVLIGDQGCGKSTFAIRLLPPELRVYYLDHINFSNKFDAEMALTHNLLVNIDEFANMGPSQQGRLKQTLSKVKVNGRPIFGRCQEDRPRFASFIATTNDHHPLCDPTGSRRFICMLIPHGQLIDNTGDITYDQLYAQVVHELREKQCVYWFNNDEVKAIQQLNMTFMKTDDLETMIRSCFAVPLNNKSWMTTSDIIAILQAYYPTVTSMTGLRMKIGRVLKSLGFENRRTSTGQTYNIISTKAA